MFKLAFIGLVVLIFISAFIIIIRNKPDLWFWIFLNLYFDPGGYVYNFLGGTLFGPLHVTDVFLSGMVICLISAGINWKVIFQDNFLRKFLFYLFLFALYYFIVYGGVVPFFQNDLNYSTFLIKNRLFVYGFIILFSVYAFALRGLYYFYMTTLFIGVICLSLFFITLFTGIPLIPVGVSERNPGEEAMRISMGSYGLFYLLFPVTVITYLISRKINLNLNYTNWLYYSGIVMIITLLITLTRRVQIDIIGSVIIIVLIISYIFRTGKLSSLLKIILPSAMVILVLSITFPEYGGYITETATDTFLLMTTGMDSKGGTDQRVSGSGEYELVKEYIGSNIFFGTGYTHMWWTGPGSRTSTKGDDFARVQDAAGEVPIYFLFFSYGIAGAILIFILYFLMGKLFFNLIKMLRINLINSLNDPLTLIIAIYILVIIAKKFTINFYALSIDFHTSKMGSTAILLGIGLALYRKLYLDDYLRNKNR